MSAPALQAHAEAAEKHGGPALLDSVDETPWQEMFVACLRYDNTVRDARGERAIKVIWDYDEVMRKGNRDKGKGKALETEDRHGSGSQTLDRDLLREQYERMAQRRLPEGNDHNMSGIESERPPYTSPERVEQRELAEQFWQRMHQREEEFEREQARLREMKKGPAFETWEMLKQRTAREAQERRWKRAREEKEKAAEIRRGKGAGGE